MLYLHLKAILTPKLSFGWCKCTTKQTSLVRLGLNSNKGFVKLASLFLAAMSSSRSDDVTDPLVCPFVGPSVRPSVPFLNFVNFEH